MEVKKVELNEIFEVDGKLYIITNLTKATDDVNPHNQCVFLLQAIQ